MTRSTFWFVTLIQILSLHDRLFLALWKHSALAILLTFLTGCASDSHHPASEPIEETSKAPPNYYGTWQWPSGGQIGSHAGNAGAMALPQASAANAGAAASPAGVGSAGAGQPELGQTASAGMSSTGATGATGGQPNQVPNSSGGGLLTGGASSGSASSLVVGGSSFGGTDSRTTSFAGNSGSSSNAATGGAASGVRVVFESMTGTTTDASIQTVVRLQNNTNTSLPLRDLSVSYWAYMQMKQIECYCDTPICVVATVGTFRTSRRGTNTCIEYTFKATYSLDPGKSMQLVYNCHYVDESPIDETTHYSHPYKVEAGDELPRVTVELGTVVVWGVEPEW